MKNNALAAIGTLAATVVFLSPAGCVIHRQMVIAEAIDKGQDPMAVKCAMETLSGVSDVAVCMAAVGK